LIRLILFLSIIYFIYAIYKKAQNPKAEPQIKNLGKAKVISGSPCPSPKTFVDYIEGKIEKKQKEEIRNHITNCKYCMDALQAIFNIPEEKLKKAKSTGGANRESYENT